LMAARTLYLEYESDQEISERRLGTLHRGHPELGEASPLYRRMMQPLTADFSILTRIIAEHDVQVLVVDSLAMACGGSPLQDPSTAVAYFAALRQLPCASISIAHVPNNAETPTIYGSVFFSNI